MLLSREGPKRHVADVNGMDWKIAYIGGRPGSFVVSNPIGGFYKG